MDELFQGGIENDEFVSRNHIQSSITGEIVTASATKRKNTTDGKHI